MPGNDSLETAGQPFMRHEAVFSSISPTSLAVNTMATHTVPGAQSNSQQPPGVSPIPDINSPTSVGSGRPATMPAEPNSAQPLSADINNSELNMAGPGQTFSELPRTSSSHSMSTTTHSDLRSLTSSSSSPLSVCAPGVGSAGLLPAMGPVRNHSGALAVDDITKTKRVTSEYEPVDENTAQRASFLSSGTATLSTIPRSVYSRAAPSLAPFPKRSYHDLNNSQNAGSSINRGHLLSPSLNNGKPLNPARLLLAHGRENIMSSPQRNLGDGDSTAPLSFAGWFSSDSPGKCRLVCSVSLASDS